MKLNRKFPGLPAALFLAAVMFFSSPALAAETDGDGLSASFEPEPVQISGSSGESKEDLFSGYVFQRFYGPVGAALLSAGDSAGNRLSGVNKNLYDCLKKEIAGVAESGGGTKFTVTPEELGMSVKTSWTRDELKNAGYSIPTTQEELGELAGVILQKQEEEAGMDPRAVLNALLADCSYELYWYDRDGGGMDSGHGAQISCDGGVLTLSGIRYTCRFTVAGGYRAVNGDLYTVAGGVARVGAALENARNIVDRCKNMDDYNKLRSYKTAICERAVYDAGDAGSGPWQLISVFDGDETASAGSEGCSRAFQYLCDLSEFQGDVVCYTVSGVTGGGTGSGLHMWNVIRIGGKSYLADVTNSGAGSAGAGGELFLAGTGARDESSAPAGYLFSLPDGSNITYYYDDDMSTTWDGGLQPLGGAILALAEEPYSPAAENALGGAARTGLHRETRPAGGLGNQETRINSGIGLAALPLFFLPFLLQISP